MTSDVKLNIGCGTTRIDGYVGVDIIPGDAVDLVGPAWAINQPADSVDEILAEHLIEHLTYFQFNRTIKEWHRVLRSGGLLVLECPDLLEICKRFVAANEYGRYWTTGEYWPLINQLYGHQKGSNLDEQMSQVHKAGFTEEHLRFVLEGVGFKDVKRVPYRKAPEGQAVMRLEARKI